MPAAPDAEDIDAALTQLREFDFSGCGDKRFGKAQEADLARFAAKDWLSFLSTGLAVKVAEGETLYYKKPIPPDALALYPTLIQQAKAEVLQKVASQTMATYDLLDRFQGELAALKRATGQLRFGELTHALLDGLKGGALRPDDLAFRLDGARGTPFA